MRYTARMDLSPSLRPCSGCPRFLFVFGITFAAAFAMISAGRAAVIEFTTEEGYVDGNLDGQPHFEVANNNPGFTVNTASGGSVAVDTSLNSRTAIFQTPVNFTTGFAYSMFIDFQFEQSSAVVAASTTFLNTLYLSGPGSGSIASTAAGLGRSTATDGYRLAFAAGAVNINGSSLGINSSLGDTTSDVLRLTFTLQQGSSSSSWMGTETIFNVTTATVVATRTSSSINIGALDPSAFYNGFGTAASASTSGLSSLTVLTYGSPVPEPSTLILCAFGAAIVGFRRRSARTSRP